MPLTNRVGDIQPFQNGKNQSVESEIILPIRTGNISKRSDDFGSSLTIAGSPAQVRKKVLNIIEDLIFGFTNAKQFVAA